MSLYLIYCQRIRAPSHTHTYYCKRIRALSNREDFQNGTRKSLRSSSCFDGTTSDTVPLGIAGGMMVT